MIKQLLLASILFLSPISVAAIGTAKTKEPEKKDWEQSLEKVKLDCDEYGEESCTARFLAMAGCTYAMGLKSDKTPAEAMDIGDRLFISMMKGHNLNLKNMFNADMNLKKNIKKETMKRLYLCKSIIEEATVKRYKEKHGKDISLKDKEGAVKAFPWWYVDEFEKLVK